MKTAQEARLFYNSEEFREYADRFLVPYLKALESTFHGKAISDITTIEKWGEFYQKFWENLPDTPRIRYGAFFTICDFAEDYCFPEDDAPV